MPLGSSLAQEKSQTRRCRAWSSDNFNSPRLYSSKVSSIRQSCSLTRHISWSESIKHVLFHLIRPYTAQSDQFSFVSCVAHIQSRQTSHLILYSIFYSDICSHWSHVDFNLQANSWILGSEYVCSSFEFEVKEYNEPQMLLITWPCDTWQKVISRNTTQGSALQRYEYTLSTRVHAEYASTRWILTEYANTRWIREYSLFTRYLPEYSLFTRYLHEYSLFTRILAIYSLSTRILAIYSLNTRILAIYSLSTRIHAIYSLSTRIHAPVGRTCIVPRHNLAITWLAE